MLRKTIKKLITIFLIILIVFTSTGCWDRIELEEQAFVILMGIDKGQYKNNIKLTVMIAIPSKIAGGGGGGSSSGGGKQEESVSVVTMEVPAVFSGLDTMNTFISRRLNVQHMKALIIGDDLAKLGVQETLGSIVRNREIRRSMLIIVGKPSAIEFIKSLQPKLGTSPTKYIEDILIMADITGAIPKAFYHTFLTNYESYGDSPYAILGTSRMANKKVTDIKEPNVPKKIAEEKTDMPDTGDPFRKGGIDIDLQGTAIFRGQKMMGELNGDETRVFNMLRGEFRRSYMTFRDPIEPDKSFVIDLRQGSPAKVKVKIEDDKPPVINVNLSLEGDLMGYQTTYNYAEDDQKRKLLEKMVSGNIKERSQDLIKKSQEKFDTDIFGFGNKGGRMHFLTWQEWVNYHWLDKFKNAQYNVTVKFAIRRIGLNFGAPKPTR